MEELYHYLWKYRMFGRELRLTDGRRLEICSAGRHNNDSGPDFFNAQIRIDGELWAGNVEIHVKASDWHRHGHDSDRVYDTVILHAVGISDTHIRRHDGSMIPQVELTMPEDFFLAYARLSDKTSSIRCAGDLPGISGLKKNDWLESLSVERLQEKGRRVERILDSVGGNWEQTCFVMLARSLGFGLNGDPFERLARNLPLKYISRHCDDIMQIEALLFGQSGMLDTSVHIFDEYYQSISHEYFFLARKYGLRPMPRDVWKYMRTRPNNFPHRRIAMLARACRGGFKMMGDILDRKGDVEALLELFNWELDGYWINHIDFDVSGSSIGLALGEQARRLILINMVSPLYYAYGNLHGDIDMAEYGIRMLEQLPAERNGIISLWKGVGLEADCALRSQALLQLRKEYCDAGKCFSCRFGYQTLHNHAVSSE